MILNISINIYPCHPDDLNQSYAQKSLVSKTLSKTYIFVYSIYGSTFQKDRILFTGLSIATSAVYLLSHLKYTNKKLKTSH